MVIPKGDLKAYRIIIRHQSETIRATNTLKPIALATDALAGTLTNPGKCFSK